MKQIVVFSMEGCSHCQEFKKMLSENSVEYVNRDIHEHSDEYQMFSKVKND
jgi:glutaredoxin